MNKEGMSDVVARYEHLLTGVREVLDKEQKEKWAVQKELEIARAEIERLKEYTTCTLESTDSEMDDKDLAIIRKDEIIKQMLNALEIECKCCIGQKYIAITGRGIICDQCKTAAAIEAAKGIKTK